MAPGALGVDGREPSAPLASGNTNLYFAAVATLTEKIAEDASRRLEVPAGRSPAQELAVYREYLKTETNRLKSLHRSGTGGREISQARSAVLDALLRHLLDTVTGRLPPLEGRQPGPRFSLVAIGGYGRGELNPCSDIDILFLHSLDGAAVARGKVHPWLTALTESLLYTLWDIGLKVGHSVRSVDDCVAVANQDMQSKTALLEARRIAGDAELFRRMETVFLARCVRGHEDDYIAARLRDQAERRAKYGGSATMQEPNIKSGCGGLRDYQNLLWMAFFKYRTRTLADLEQRDLISEAERVQLESAYDFLLRVRNELHYESGRPADALPRALQPKVANNLGFGDRSPVRRLETFMREVYRHMRNIHLITRTLEQRLALLPDPQRRLPSFRQLLRTGRRRIRRQLVDGFQFVDGEICPTSTRVFRDQPRRLLRVFFYAQQRGLRLNPDLAQLLRNQLQLVTPEFLQDPHVRETFLEILNQRGNVAPILRAMHEVGLLGRYLPEFEPLTCLVQHEFYHQYTADEHTLRCVEHLDQIWEAKEPPHRNYTDIFHGVERPFVLYLALLLHDAGKASRGGDHSSTGAQLALEVAQRLGLDGTTAHSLQLVIEHHLLMARVSQRRDLDDPAVIRSLAAQLQTEQNLRLLTLHTVVDSLGTSDKLWNGFKDSLLLRLYRRTSDHLAGTTGRLRAEVRQRELLAEEVRAQRPDRVHSEEVDAHFATLPDRYFHIHSTREILADLNLVHAFLRRQRDESQDPFVPVLFWQDEPDRGYTVVKVCTWDRRGLFSKITGSLTAAGLNILTAQIFTRADSIALDTFFVTDARTGLPVNREEREKFERLLPKAVAGEVNLQELIARRPALAPLYTSLEGERMPTSVRLDHETSDTCTILDLEAEDHVGLLYAVTRVLAEAGLNISLAKILTEKGAAVDTFYLCEEAGGKVHDPARQDAIESRLRREISLL